MARRTQRPKDQGKKNGRSEERPSSGRKRPGRAAALQSENRNTALQQYAEVALCLQGTKYNYSRQNAAEMLEKIVANARILIRLLPPAAFVRRSIGKSP
jgi:hypothetical protein